ncbi:MAG: hypothetical protein O3A93_13975 [Chloroflexi bacterium]|nr:hypothetical protein [Chloroflexota bacterium]
MPKSGAGLKAMETAEIVAAVIGGSTVALLVLVMVLFRSVYIILPRKDFEADYVLKATLSDAENLEEETALA